MESKPLSVLGHDGSARQGSRAVCRKGGYARSRQHSTEPGPKTLPGELKSGAGYKFRIQEPWIQLVESLGPKHCAVCAQLPNQKQKGSLTVLDRVEKEDVIVQ